MSCVSNGKKRSSNCKRYGKFLRKRGYDIKDFPLNADLSLPPSSGVEYLYRVYLESNQCPATSTSTKDFSHFQSRQNVTFDVCNGFKSAPLEFRPSSKWQEIVLNGFSGLKDKIRCKRNELCQRFPKQAFPKLHKIEDWCLFCLGSNLYYRLYNNSMSEASEDETKVISNKKKRLCTLGAPPLFSYLLYMNQQMIEMLISYHKEWMEEIGMNLHQGRWLYALLMFLEKPLNPNACALLRDLSRLCSNLRSELKSPSDENLKPLNLIISIVAHYFDQKDMDDIEEKNAKN